MCVCNGAPATVNQSEAIPTVTTKRVVSAITCIPVSVHVSRPGAALPRDPAQHVVARAQGHNINVSVGFLVSALYKSLEVPDWTIPEPDV